MRAIIFLVLLAGCAHVAATRATFSRQADGPVVLRLARHLDTIVRGPDSEEDQFLELELQRATPGQRLRIPSDDVAVHFSDAMESRESSIGLFRTADTYVGHNGYSLRLDGLEPGFNGNARERAIVMHGAPYVNADVAKANGRLGRSWGCPALNEAVARKVIDTVRGGGVIFSYYPDSAWLKKSKFLNCPASSKPATVLATVVATN